MIEKLYRFPPRYGPEWGSGGIFGLRYHRGVLYFTVAFEAEAHFISDETHRVYRFEKAGYLPTSGGDTYNAVDAVDEYIYFGGWVHAPARYAGRRGRGGIILFYDKFSHVHSYNVAEDKVELLWKEGIGHESRWAGEVSDIIYDPINDRLLLARGDGHENLGIYSLDRRGGKAVLLSDKTSLKGSLLSDYACFDHTASWREGVRAIQCLDLVEDRLETFQIDYAKNSIDYNIAFFTQSGCAISAYGKYIHFVRGGVLIGNPIAGEDMTFYRLFDFGLSGYGPLRTVALPVGGGILTAFNAYTHGILYPRTEEEKMFAEATNRIVGPTVLLYITPPQAKIVATLGARVTSIEKVGDKLLLGTSTTANYGALDAGPVDAGWKDVLAVDTDILFRDPSPATFVISGSQVLDMAWGGIPLYGYRNPKLVISASRDNTLTVYTYDISIPPLQAEEDKLKIARGRNVIDLSSFKGIVSFKLEVEDEGMRAKIVLE